MKHKTKGALWIALPIVTFLISSLLASFLFLWGRFQPYIIPFGGWELFNVVFLTMLLISVASFLMIPIGFILGLLQFDKLT